MFIEIDNEILMKFENIEFIEKREDKVIFVFLDKHIGNAIFFDTESERNNAFDKISTFLDAKDFNAWISEIE